MPGPRLFNQFFELAIPQIAEDKPRSLQRVLRKLRFDLGIDGSGNDCQIWPAIVVEIGEPGAPADVAGFNPEAGRNPYIRKVTSSIIAIQHVGVVCKTSLK